MADCKGGGDEDSAHTDLSTTSNPEGYYDNWAATYESTVRAWGYNMPEIAVQMLAEARSELQQVGVAEHRLRVLDCGCGDGLVAVALRRSREAKINDSLSLSDVTGTDISDGMLEIAAARNAYDKLIKADLNGSLPFAGACFDAVLCVGTSTYLSNPAQVLSEWRRIIRPGGLLIVTHKTTVWPAWEEVQDKMEEQGQLKKINVSEPLPYLPNFTHAPSDETVRVYVYQTCSSQNNMCDSI